MIVRIASSAKEREDAFQIRMEVFVEEQHVPAEEELDIHDETAIHFIGYAEEKAVAASRLRFSKSFGKLERICVLKEYRGKNYGKLIMDEMEKVIVDKGYKQAKLHAQIQAEDFYKKIGYETVSDTFMDAGIPHVTMVKSFN